MLKPFSAEWARLLRRLDRLAGNTEAAEDALQSAYIRIEEYRRSNPVHKPKALLVRTAVNLALDERRRAARTAWSELGESACEIHDEQPLQDEVLAARERLMVVEAVLARIPARTRDAFVMHRVDGLKYREIAERLGVSVSAVEKHIARAAFLLAEAMQEYEGRT
jgi:RNA polymerase sigma factor (sigma-70 family)